MHLLVVGVLVIGLDHKQNDGLLVVEVMEAVILAHSCCHSIGIVCGHIILGYALEHLQAAPRGVCSLW